MAEQDRPTAGSSDAEDPALARLDRDLEAVRDRQAAEAAKRRPDADPRQTATVGKAWSLAIEMVAAVGVSVFIGWWLDRWLGSAPWGLVGFILLGIAAAMWSAIRTGLMMQRQQLADSERDAKKEGD
ncbi:MAG: AtpZ/AtpI family protein [Ferrovibrio sp.]|uniref:AtpZ/AtpI family protein n=1 Tax=Ferrovibrio sp. TaxID=1917215 RepID=UPI00262DE1BA|nr:AtpZ/AtpI family protein [Ferrovibrio sp.]MCW0233571.1 AtpZ/AtpI family protein [Ferrovibrio sp.]